MKIIEHKARDVKSGETVLDRGTGSLSKRSVLVRNTGRSRSSTWRASGTGFITQMNTWEKSYCSSIDPTKR